MTILYIHKTSYSINSKIREKNENGENGENETYFFGRHHLGTPKSITNLEELCLGWRPIYLYIFTQHDLYTQFKLQQYYTKNGLRNTFTHGGFVLKNWMEMMAF